MIVLNDVDGTGRVGSDLLASHEDNRDLLQCAHLVIVATALDLSE